MDATPADPAPRRYGGFDVLRILAALAVLLSHSFAISGHRADALRYSVGHYHVALGTLGVSIFFVISGLLVATSWDRLADGRTFVRHRVARIWPALTATIVLTVFVLGPLTTVLRPVEYLTQRATMLYLGRNIVLFAGTINHLPGVFLDHPVRSVNGSIWTLTYEVWAYVLVLGLGLTGLLRRWWVPVLVLAGFVVTFRTVVYEHLGHLPVTRTVLGVSLTDGSVLLTFFFLGVVASRLVHRVPPRRWLLPSAALLALAFLVGEPVLYVVGLAGCVVGIGSFGGRVLETVHSWGDPSYGLYITAFPIQQLLYSAGIRSAWSMFAVAGAITMGVGYLSWHRLERPLLRRARRSAPVAATA